jgi:hypothetical protein
MTKTNTFRHDNLSTGSSLIPDPKEIQQDTTDRESLIDDFKTLHTANEKSPAGDEAVGLPPTIEESFVKLFVTR